MSSARTKGTTMTVTTGPGTGNDARTGRSRATVSYLRRPPRARVLRSDVVSVVWFVAGVTLGLWVVHGGIGGLLAGGTETLAALGQLSGLVAALAAMGGLILTSRPRFLERRYGQDRLIATHRWFGITTAFALLVHVVADSWAWAGDPVTGLVDLVRTQPWMVAALAATVLVFAVALSSWRRLRRRIPYETWYFVHLTGYLAVLLGFGHQVTLGSDVAPDRFALAWWWLLAATVVGVVAWCRVGDLARSMTRRFHVTAVTREADGIGAVHVAGPGLRGLRAAPGQYFNVRALTPDLWWQAHPYSLSVAPTTGGLRFTVKELGDGSSSLLRVRPGTRLMLEGPYGVFTADRAEGAPVVLVAGGVGISPIRAILEDCTPDQRPYVIVRVRRGSDLAHRAELERLVASRRGTLEVLVGRREWFSENDPFAAEALRARIPGLAARHVYVCGAASLESAVMAGMRKAGVPTQHIHHESFGV